MQEWLSLGKQPHSIPHEMMREIVQGWYQDLLREHSESRWPEYGGSRLYNWILSQTDSAIDVSPIRNTAILLPGYLYFLQLSLVAKQHLKVFLAMNQVPFFLRQVRDFDSRWFNAIFQYSLLRNIAEK